MRGRVTSTRWTPQRKPDFKTVALCSPGVGQLVPWSTKQQSVHMSLVPGCCSQRRDPCLKYSHEELERVFFDYHEIYERKEDASMDDEAHYHGNHVHPQLPGNHLQVSNGDDLSTDEASNTQRGVPAGEQIYVSCPSSSDHLNAEQTQGERC